MIYDRRYIEFGNKKTEFLKYSNYSEKILCLKGLKGNKLSFKDILKLGLLFITATFFYIIQSSKKFLYIVLKTEILGKTFKEKTYVIIFTLLIIMIIIIRLLAL
ncbi:MAG: hypothetical protein ACQER9_01405 [Nanobdellota archaeon]